jgi:hypothetical protein
MLVPIRKRVAVRPNFPRLLMRRKRLAREGRYVFTTVA